MTHAETRSILQVDKLETLRTFGKTHSIDLCPGHSLSFMLYGWVMASDRISLAMQPSFVEPTAVTFGSSKSYSHSGFSLSG